MIHCISDDIGMRTKYVELCKAILSEYGLKNVSDVEIDIKMKEGYIMISADMKESPKPSTLADCGHLENLDGALIFHLNPSCEMKIPLIRDILIKRYGEKNVIGISRYDIKFPPDVVEAVGDLIVEDHESKKAENLSSILTRILPEGFRIMKSKRNGARLTILCSPYLLKVEWVERMDRLHSRPI